MQSTIREKIYFKMMRVYAASKYGNLEDFRFRKDLYYFLAQFESKLRESFYHHLRIPNLVGLDK